MSTEAPDGDDVIASRVEIVDVAQVEALLADPAGPVLFSEGELAYARARSDPARRLAARLAAKRAAAALLGAGVTPADVEVVRGEYGPPALRLSSHARECLARLGAVRLLVSLTHEREHAAALVMLLAG